MTATAASRRSFPAWIDADESVAAFTVTTITPRVRDSLVLRAVRTKKTARKDPHHAAGGQ